MRCKKILFYITLFVFALLILTACTKKECKTDLDCKKPHFTSSCADYKCRHAPIPGECGNAVCETTETKCSCPIDCGECGGKTGLYLVGTCTRTQPQECIQDIPQTSIKPVFLTSEQTSQGDKFRISITFNQPFNLNKHTIALRIGLAQENEQNLERRITRVTLTGQTKDKRTITLAEKAVNKITWEPGLDIREELILDFPAQPPDGEITNLALFISYDYLAKTGTTYQKKTASYTLRYPQQTFTYVKPTNTYPCPDCNDNNPGTTDECGPQTNNFCQHTPIPDTCGNSFCDTQENTCTCPQDCGSCKGKGIYTIKTCKENQCIAQLKSSTKTTPQSLFDDRNLNIFQFNTYYKYNTPFNTQTDKFIIETTLNQLGPNVASLIIEAVRLLEGDKEIALTSLNKPLTSLGTKQTIELSIPAQSEPEVERTITTSLYYSYDQNGPKKGVLQKPLGKITLLSPQ